MSRKLLLFLIAWMGLTGVLQGAMAGALGTPGASAASHNYGPALSSTGGFGPVNAGTIMGTPQAVGSVADTSIGPNSDGVNVQTNIDSSKSISAQSNVSVNETINGANVAYGLSGANVFTSIDNANSFAGGVMQQRAEDAQEGVDQGLVDAALSQIQGN